MEIIIYLGELFLTYFSAFSTTTAILIFGSLFLYSLRENKKYRARTDEKIDQVITMQKEMQKEYRDGLVKIDKKLEYSTASTNEALEVLAKQQTETKLMTLRSIITNPSLPEEYRLTNFDIYTSEGGNSWLNAYVQKEILSKQNKTEE